MDKFFKFNSVDEEVFNLTGLFFFYKSDDETLSLRFDSDNDELCEMDLEYHSETDRDRDYAKLAELLGALVA